MKRLIYDAWTWAPSQTVDRRRGGLGMAPWKVVVIVVVWVAYTVFAAWSLFHR